MLNPCQRTPRYGLDQRREPCPSTQRIQNLVDEKTSGKHLLLNLKERALKWQLLKEADGHAQHSHSSNGRNGPQDLKGQKHGLENGVRTKTSSKNHELLELESEEVSGADITKAAVTGRKSNKDPPCIKAMEAHGAGKREADGHQNWNY